jgi:AAA+ ATPase superfamily predicted ATPase
MKNPFYIKEIPVDGAFCNRVKELHELESFAKSSTNVVLFSPRRFGKTSLTKRVQLKLNKQGYLTVFCDFFGVSSAEEVAARIAKSIYAMTHKNETIFSKALKFITAFRPVLESNPEGGVSFTVQPAFKKNGIDVITETMESLQKFISDIKMPVHIAFDEFQELTEIENSLSIEGILRQYIQQIPCSFFFIGSRRRLLIEMFNARKRPFFQSALNYQLKPLPAAEIIEFIVKQFKQNGKIILEEHAALIAQLVECHPYYMQKFCFLLYSQVDKKVSEKDVFNAYNLLFENEKFVFESILQGLSPKQISLLTALAREPVAKVYSLNYISVHNLGSTGSVQKNLNKLSLLDLVEKNEYEEWHIVDPVFKVWLIHR